MKPKIYQRNNFIAGAGIGILLPVVFAGFLLSADWLTTETFGFHLSQEKHYLYLLSMTINLLTMRYYFVNLKYEKTGMGLLLITTLAIVAYFFLY